MNTVFNLLAQGYLVHSLDIEKRNRYREQKWKILEKSGKKYREPIIIIIEDVTADLRWKNTCVIGERQWRSQCLKNFIKKKPEDSVSFSAMRSNRNGVFISGNLSLGEIYDRYHDQHDKMLYLRVAGLNSFG